MKIAARKVGMVQIYTGTDGSTVGWLDDFDGKWVYLTLNSFRTIGNSSSGADIANDWVSSLFGHFWYVYTASICPILDPTGAASSRTSIAADWAANKRIKIPDFRGRSFIGAGTGALLTNRTKGFYGGVETVTLGINEMPAHSHVQNPSTVLYDGNPPLGCNVVVGGSNTLKTAAVNNAATYGSGGGTAHENMQPSAFEHFLISAGMR